MVRQAEAQGTILRRTNGISYKYIQPLIIAPKDPLGSALNFENTTLNEWIEIGRQRAMEVLKQETNKQV